MSSYYSGRFDFDLAADSFDIVAQSLFSDRTPSFDRISDSVDTDC